MSASLFDEASEQLLPRDGSAILHRDVLNHAEASTAFERLLVQVPWEQRSIRLFGREVQQPRLVAWFGDPGRSYRYSGIDLDPLPWTGLLLDLKARCERVSQATFNNVLANLYRDGRDGVAWHSDDEPELGELPVVASLSLGTERRFDLRHKETEETIKTVLPSGSVLVMSGPCQQYWSHQVPKSTKVQKPRINLTFRWIESPR